MSDVPLKRAGSGCSWLLGPQLSSFKAPVCLLFWPLSSPGKTAGLASLSFCVPALTRTWRDPAIGRDNLCAGRLVGKDGCTAGSRREIEGGGRLERSLGLGLRREPHACPWLAYLLLKFPAQHRDVPAGLWPTCHGEERGLVCCWPSPTPRHCLPKQG